MTRTVRLCQVSELRPGEVRRFDVDGLSVCLAHCSAGFKAIVDTCSHEDFSLAEGELDPETCEIECWKHGSLFSLETGQPLTFPATQPVATFEVVLDADEVAVVLP